MCSCIEIVKTVVGSWTEADYASEDAWKDLCTSYRRISIVRYEKSRKDGCQEYRNLIRSLEVMP